MPVEILAVFVDRCIALLKRREEVNRALYVDFVSPLMNDFERLHENYLSTFRAYRDTVNTSVDQLTPEHPVFDQIRTDSLYSRGLREKLWQVDAANAHKGLAKLVESIRDYLTAPIGDLMNLILGVGLNDAIEEMSISQIKQEISAAVGMSMVLASLQEQLHRSETKAGSPPLPTERDNAQHITLGGRLVINPSEQRYAAVDELWAHARTYMNIGRVAAYSRFVEIFRSSVSDETKRRLAVAALDSIIDTLQNSYSSVAKEHAALKRRILRQH
jgi:hypothetical protein